MLRTGDPEALMLRKYPGIDGQMATPWGCRRLLACWPHEAKQSYIRTLRAGFRSTRFSCGQCAGLFRRLHTACAYCLRRRSAASLGCIRTARGRRGTASHGRLLAWRALAIRRQAGLPICRRGARRRAYGRAVDARPALFRRRRGTCAAHAATVAALATPARGWSPTLADVT